MFSRKNKKKGFTLIEMLIVIVIIGILMAALIPRLTGARGRANDIARKADLSQTASALVSYQIDNQGSFPSTVGSLSGITSELLGAGMSSIPTDPTSDRSFLGIWSSTVSNGQFGYTRIYKWGIQNNGFVLMAGTETEGGSNRVYTGTSITEASSYENIKICKIFTAVTSSPSNDGNGNCSYIKNSDQLRYIYLY